MDYSIRSSDLEDGEVFKQLLLEPDVLEFFPMYDLREIEDSIRIWEIFCKKGASLTAVVEEKAAGLAFLNLQGYKKFAHQCIITILVDNRYRNRGIGTALLKELFKLAKENFQMEILHLEVYETNPAIRLYERMGFTTFGVHKRFIKELDGRYIDKIMMERSL
jgi:ribosomal protein S18 acetylase RimI-like enzyme